MTLEHSHHPEKPLRFPALSELPQQELDPGAMDSHHIVGFETRSPLARPFNLLRSQVAKRCEQGGWSVIGITSAEPGAGKSFVALNLAAALSRMGQQAVYLLDLDFSRASVARALGMKPERGLSDYLSGDEVDLRKAGWRMGDSNLAVFPTRRAEGSAAPLLSGERFTRLIEQIRSREQASIVICDLPPAFANDDAMIAVQQLDAYLLVVEAGKTTRAQLTDTASMLDPAPRLGMVLNRYEGGFADPYGYGAYSKIYSDYY